MTTPVEIAPGYGYGLGLEVTDSPCGRLFGHSGAIPGYRNVVFNSEDGTHQFGAMMNALKPPPAAWGPIDLVIAQGIREAFAGEPCAAAASQTQGLQDGQARQPLEHVALRRPAAARPLAR